MLGHRLTVGVLVTFVILILQISPFATAQNTTAVGVSDGDSFKVTATKVSGDFAGEGISEGDVRTMTIVDADPDFDNDIIIEERGGGEPYQFYNTMDEPGEFVIFTDWDHWDSQGNLVIASDWGLSQSNIDVINGAEEFEFYASESFGDASIVLQFIYFKDTGVMKKIRMKITSPDVSGELVIEHGDKSDDGFLPGFEISIAFVSIVAISFIIRRWKF